VSDVNISLPIGRRLWLLFDTKKKKPKENARDCIKES